MHTLAICQLTYHNTERPVGHRIVSHYTPTGIETRTPSTRLHRVKTGHAGLGGSLGDSQ